MTKFNQQELDILRRMFPEKLSDDDFQVFVHACTKSGLDPFMKQIYALSRDQRDYKTGEYKASMFILTGIDGYRLLAERTGKYMPGRECVFAYDNGKLFSATSYVKKMASDGSWHEISNTSFWEEYVCVNNKGVVNPMWRTKPHIMLGKCAEACVLRKAFPADLSGIYTKEEMDQANNPLPTAEKESPPKENKETVELVSEEQLNALESLVGDDQDYLKKVYSLYEIDSLFFVPAKAFPALLRSAQARYDAVRGNTTDS